MNTTLEAPVAYGILFSNFEGDQPRDAERALREYQVAIHGSPVEMSPVFSDDPDGIGRLLGLMAKTVPIMMNSGEAGGAGESEHRFLMVAENIRRQRQTKISSAAPILVGVVFHGCDLSEINEVFTRKAQLAKLNS